MTEEAKKKNLTTKQKEKKTEEIQKKVNEVLNLEEMAKLLKSNEVVFDIDKVTYRVKKSSYKQKQEAYKKRVEKFTELLQDDKYMMEEDLKTLYLKRNIDVDAMLKKSVVLMEKRDVLMFKLGEAITNKAPDLDLQTYKKEVDILNFEIQGILTKKAQLLEFSIENQVLVYTYSYLTFLIAEKKEGDNFVRLWNTWEEFEGEKENIVNKLSYYVTMISNSEEI